MWPHGFYPQVNVPCLLIGAVVLGDIAHVFAQWMMLVQLSTAEVMIIGWGIHEPH